MNKKVARNTKQYYDRNEVRIRPKFCIYKRLGDYVFIWETAYIKEKWVPEWNLHDTAYQNMKTGHAFNKQYISEGKWVFLAALTKKEAFIESL